MHARPRTRRPPAPLRLTRPPVHPARCARTTSSGRACMDTPGGRPWRRSTKTNRCRRATRCTPSLWACPRRRS
eukprot:7043470-Prymnesium_polylepis.1